MDKSLVTIGFPRPDLRGRYVSRRALAQLLAVPIRRRIRVSAIVAAFVGCVVAVAMVLRSGSLNIAPIAAGVTITVITLYGPVLFMPTAERRILAFYVQGRLFTSRPYRGGNSTPVSHEQRVDWMANHPVDMDVLATAGAHMYFLIEAGDYDAAETIADAIPQDTPIRAFERSIWLARIDFERGGEGSLEEARRWLGQIESPRGKSSAGVAYAEEGARRALILGEDWRVPLIRGAEWDHKSILQDVLTVGALDMRVSRRFLLSVWLVVLVLMLLALIQFWSA